MLVAATPAVLAAPSAVDPRIEQPAVPAGKVKPIEAVAISPDGTATGLGDRERGHVGDHSGGGRWQSRALCDAAAKPGSCARIRDRLGTRFASPGFVSDCSMAPDQHKVMQNDIYLADTTGKGEPVALTN
jgi:hypothetical protein